MSTGRAAGDWPVWPAGGRGLAQVTDGPTARQNAGIKQDFFYFISPRLLFLS